jgi:hypothetical protein
MGFPERDLRIFLTKVDGARGDTSLPIVCEALDFEKNFQLEIKPADGFRWSMEELLKFTDRFYRKVWKKTNSTKKEPEEGVLLRIGQGSSAYSTSLLLFAEQNNIGQEIYRFPRPRTSKQVEGDGSMGWVLLHPSGETEIQKALSVKTLAQSPTVATYDADTPQEGISEVWDNALLKWTPNDQTIHAIYKDKKAFAKGKELVPEGIRKTLIEKKKSITAKVEVKPIGNGFEIIKIIA